MEGITITIGRNVGDEPMSADRWSEFTTSVRNALERHGAEVWTSAAYTGSWEGASEDSHVFLGGAEALDGHELRRELGALAGEYGQEAIGLNVGPAELVRPAPVGVR